MATADVMQMDGSTDHKKALHPFFGKPAATPKTSNHGIETTTVNSHRAEAVPEVNTKSNDDHATPQSLTAPPSASPSPKQIQPSNSAPKKPRKRTSQPKRSSLPKDYFQSDGVSESIGAISATNSSIESSPATAMHHTPARKRQRLSPPTSDEKRALELGMTLARGIDESELSTQHISQPIPNSFFGHVPEHPTPMIIDREEPIIVEESKAVDGVLENRAVPKSAGDGPVDQTAKPKKLVYFNIASGTIGSPPPKKATKSVDPPKKRGRSKKVKSMVVVIPYLSDGEPDIQLGQRIDAVLAGEEVIAPKKPEVIELPETPKAKRTTPKRTAPKPFNLVKQHKPVVTKAPPATKPAATAKSTHPFFLGKAAVKETPKDTLPTSKRASPKPVKTYDSPPRKLTAKPVLKLAPKGSAAIPKPGGNSFAAFGSQNKMQKVPGALEPAWPASGMVHSRGDMEGLPILDDSNMMFHYKASKKAKYSSTILGREEDIIYQIMSQLHLPDIKKEVESISPDHYEPPASHLRLPKRYFESGIELQKRALPQIKSSVDGAGHGDSGDELAMDSADLYPHCAVSKIYKAIPSSLSQFDRGLPCTQTWVTKYAPQTAAEVLQTGREAYVLKEWLQTQTAVGVDDGSNKKPPPRKRKEKTEFPAPKKRKSKNLDDFVVSDDDVDSEMAEADDFDSTPQNTQGGLRTVIRRGDAHVKQSGESKLHNAVVISGPSGAGKTAAVYAVAKELGFEVFEINSSTRRNGKDILEKVGDMTKNHLVQQGRRGSNEHNEDFKKASEALDKDLKSGRQGTMNSFFKPTAAPKKEAKPKKIPKAAKKETESKKSKIQQKQSLILLEEVDILFKEDKEFWLTVLELIATSKRPIIMTCNDEAIVLPHLAACPLHAIIRFQPPPVDTAVDYLLLVAANEGHHIYRKAIEMLYKETHFDLRRSMTELEAWCQMCIGDRKGGLDWFMPRWPTGQDLDAHGRKMRVVSHGTYRQGQGWLGHDFLSGKASTAEKEMELMNEAWEGWQIDAGDWHDSLKMDQHPAFSPSTPANANFGILEAYDSFASAMSDSDLVSSHWFGTDNATPLDTTLPTPTQKRLEDNQLGHYFLPADLAAPQSTLSRDLTFAVRTLAKTNLNTHLTKSNAQPLPALIEKRLHTFIVERATQAPEGCTRSDFATAFDPIATTSFTSSNVYTLEPTQLDRTTSLIAEDIAPYIRHIVAYDQELAEERRKKSNLLVGVGRGGGKRMRMTRTAMASLEGGKRGSTRRERWFGENVKVSDVDRTGGEWRVAARAVLERKREERMVGK